jgi:hypothetical protein
MQHRTSTPLHRIPRIGGALYLSIIVLGLFQELVVRDRVIVTGNPTMTSTNLRSMESLWRVGVAAEFILLICALCLTVILFLLLEPVSRALALLVVVFNVAAIVTEAAATLYLLQGLVHLSTGLPVTQMEAMVSTSLAMHSYGFAAALIFFGVECVVVGYLLVISRLVPRVIGLLMGLAGACYLVNSFSMVVAPDLADRLFPAILIPAFVGETSLALWLLIQGTRNPATSRPDTHLAVTAA